MGNDMFWNVNGHEGNRRSERLITDGSSIREVNSSRPCGIDLGDGYFIDRRDGRTKYSNDLGMKHREDKNPYGSSPTSKNPYGSSPTFGSSNGSSPTLGSPNGSNNGFGGSSSGSPTVNLLGDVDLGLAALGAFKLLVGTAKVVYKASEFTAKGIIVVSELSAEIIDDKFIQPKLVPYLTEKSIKWDSKELVKTRERMQQLLKEGKGTSEEMMDLQTKRDELIANIKNNREDLKKMKNNINQENNKNKAAVDFSKVKKNIGERSEFTNKNIDKTLH